MHNMQDNMSEKTVVGSIRGKPFSEEQTLTITDVLQQSEQKVGALIALHHVLYVPSLSCCCVPLFFIDLLQI